MVFDIKNMPSIDIKKASSDWQAGKFSPVYIFAGEEPYFHEETLNKLEKALNVDTLNREIFYAPDTSVHDIVLAAQTIPFIAERRLVIVKEAQRIKQTEASKLAEFLKSPSETSCLVLLWPEKIKKDAMRSPLFSAVEKSGAVVEFKPVYERDIPSWIHRKAAERKKTVTSDAAEYLLQESGTSLMDLNNELEKLFLFVGDRKEINLQDVETLSGHTKQVNLYELSEAVESKDLKGAMRIIEPLLNEGEVPVIILSFINTAIRKLLIAKSLLEDCGLRRDEISQKLRLHPYFSRSFFTNLDKHTKNELIKDLQLVLEADIALKSSAQPDNAVFEELLLGLCGNSADKL